MAPPSEMSRRLTFLFALAAGVAIGNLYWAQPLLGFIAGDLRAATSTAGWLITATQVGYAVGVLLLVPLGDVLDRRRFVPVMLLASVEWNDELLELVTVVPRLVELEPQQAELLDRVVSGPQITVADLTAAEVFPVPAVARKPHRQPAVISEPDSGAPTLF